MTSTISRYCSIVCISLTAVLTLFIVQALNGQWTWIAEGHEGVFGHMPQLSAEFLPVPLAFLLWVRLMERDKPFSLSFSPLACAVSIEGFAAAVALADNPYLQQFALALGVVAGLFVLLPIHEAIKRAMVRWWPTIIALIGGTAACNYYFLMRVMWAQMCSWTADMVFSAMSLFDINLNATIYADNFIIESRYFSINVMKGCNGLEGIFLFNFMLSVVLLLDWDLFKRRNILGLYLFGLAYMFLFNALRISTFFTLGYWTHHPGIPDWLESLQGSPLYLFHSYVGWVFYLVAFGIFAAWLYPSKTGKAS